jgi:hypothetical protein
MTIARAHNLETWNVAKEQIKKANVVANVIQNRCKPFVPHVRLIRAKVSPSTLHYVDTGDQGTFAV